MNGSGWPRKLMMIAVTDFNGLTQAAIQWLYQYAL